jgi:hypothetical protein
MCIFLLFICAAPDENMELFVWWWDELLPCATAPNTKFWTSEKWWYHHIHDGKVGDDSLLFHRMKLLPSFAAKNTTGNGKEIPRSRQNTPKRSS